MRTVKVGDRVLLSCITSCGACENCRRQRYGICTGGGGWLLGHTIDGVQAQYARVPFADTLAYLVPKGDMSEPRLARATEFGATDTVMNAGLAVEAVGIPATFELAMELVAAGGRLANIGVHGKPALLHLERLWTRDVTITMGLVDTHTIRQLLKLVQGGQLHSEALKSHTFSLDGSDEAHAACSDAVNSHAMKVVMQEETLLEAARKDHEVAALA